MSCTPAGRRVPAAGESSSLERMCAAPSAAHTSTTSARRAKPVLPGGPSRRMAPCDPACPGSPGAPHRRSGRGWSGQVEPVEVHDLVPRGNEVADELLRRVVARVDLGDRTELGVGAEDQVEPGAGPLQLARPTITALEGVPGLGGRLPLRAHVEKVREEVV